jgi:prepilin signal peptidase PulO-like enzyme (type II secretory pathway)
VPVVVSVTVWLTVLALGLGSFWNLASDRLPREESLLHPRSHCRACGRVLTALDLLPVLGYAVRRGRCASCEAPIGLSQPAVEAACGLVMVGACVALGPWPGGLVGLAAVCAVGGLVIGCGLRGRLRW